MTGNLDAATALVDESIRRIRQGEDRAHFAEVLRIRGWLYIQQGKAQMAETDLRESIGVARTQKAKSWELRSSTTLARLLAERGEPGEAVNLLSPIYDWFTEGFDTKDLKEARALLDLLSC
jgi:predicted ATPase